MYLEIFGIAETDGGVKITREAVCDSFTSLIWDVKYYECGNFEVYIAASEYAVQTFQKGRIVGRSDDKKHFGIIEAVNLSTSAEDGDYLTITGRFLMSLLSRRIILSQLTYKNAQYAQIVRRAVSENAIDVFRRTIPGLELGTVHGSCWSKLGTLQVTHDNLMDFVYSVCATVKGTADIRLEETAVGSGTYKMLLDLSAGVDRSLSQDANPHVVFSDEYSNLLTFNCSTDRSTLQNYAYVYGMGEGAERSRATCFVKPEPTGFDRYEVYVDAKDLTNTETDETGQTVTMTSQEYGNALRERGNESLVDALETVESEIVTDGRQYQYGVDYAVGDWVTVEHTRFGISQPRIQLTGMIECMDESGYSLTPSFSGTAIETSYGTSDTGDPQIPDTGKDGYSPIVTLTRQDNGVLITVQDAEGIKTAFVADGQDGETPDVSEIWNAIHALQADSHTHENKDVLDSTTAPYTTEEKGKLSGIEDGANKYVHPTYTSRTSGLYKITVDGTGHVSGATSVAKSDITALGIPGSDTNTTYRLSKSGSTITLTGSDGKTTSVKDEYVTQNLYYPSSSSRLEYYITFSSKDTESTSTNADGLTLLYTNDIVVAPVKSDTAGGTGAYIKFNDRESVFQSNFGVEKHGIILVNDSFYAYKAMHTSWGSYYGSSNHNVADPGNASWRCRPISVGHAVTKDEDYMVKGAIDFVGSTTDSVSQLEYIGLAFNYGSSHVYKDYPVIFYRDGRIEAANATQSEQGLMSAADKTKLDGIATGANNYTHPTYTSKTSGLYKITVNSTGHVSATAAVTASDLPSHTHSYLPLSGGTITKSSFGPLTIKRAGSTNGASIGFANSNGTLGYIGMSNGVNSGLKRWSADTKTVYTVLDTSNYSDYALPVDGNAASATKLTTSAGSATKPVYFSNGKPVAGTYTLAAACAKGVTDSSSASAIGTGTNLPTERDIYYGLPTINGSHAYTSSTKLYAPTTIGTKGYVLVSTGGEGIDIPQWANGRGIATGMPTNGKTYTYEETDYTGSSTCEIFNDYTNNQAATSYSHAEGYGTKALNYRAHAEGYLCVATGENSHAEGDNTVASGNGSHAEGGYTTASGKYSHAGGDGTTASGINSFATGYHTTASGSESAAFGYNTAAAGEQSFAGGVEATATGKGAFSFGQGTQTAAQYQVALGSYNSTSQSTATHRLTIGCGTSGGSRTNCFRVATTGVYAAGAYSSSGADYAEYFEWQDGNPEGEDRRGRFVTYGDGETIQLASPGDAIIGVVSGNPSVIGDSFEDHWQGRYLRDIYGAYILEEQEDEEGNPIIGLAMNPDYDPNQTYTPRSERPEWSLVGMVGKLVVEDDGTCQVNSYCTVGAGGKATKSDTGWRVIARVDETHVKILYR